MVRSFWFMSLCVSQVCVFSVEATVPTLLLSQLVSGVVTAHPTRGLCMWHQVLLSSVTWVSQCSGFWCFRDEITLSSLSNSNPWQLEGQVGKPASLAFQEGGRVVWIETPPYFRHLTWPLQSWFRPFRRHTSCLAFPNWLARGSCLFIWNS